MYDIVISFDFDYIIFKIIQIIHSSSNDSKKGKINITNI